MRPRKIIIERLHFDKAQIEQFESIIDEHREMVTANEAEINDVKNDLYQQLNVSMDSAKVDSLSKTIADLQKRAVMINFRHFQNIKKICKPEQMPYFEKLTNELSQLFSRKRPESQK